MKPKDFRNCYLSFVQLYGAIFSDDASNIIKIYFPDLKKSELINDLRSRCDKLTRGYAIIKAVKGKYVICDELYDYDDLDKLFDRQTDKPFFIPKTYEEFLKYQDYSFWEEQHKDELDGLQRFLAKRCDKPEAVTKTLFTHISRGSLAMAA